MTMNSTHAVSKFKFEVGIMTELDVQLQTRVKRDNDECDNNVEEEHGSRLFGSGASERARK